MKRKKRAYREKVKGQGKEKKEWERGKGKTE
jgi:hypothetical protein